jgi:tRNA(fMet)-specific endonuclease VapC
LNGYLLDTNTIGYYFGKHVNVIARIDSLPDETPMFVSAIALGEIAFGHSLTHSTDHHRRDEFDRFINNEFPKAFTVNVTRHTRIYYGDLKAKLFVKFPPKSASENHPERCVDRATGAELGIDENDLWMAAQAIEHNLILVTNDEMKRIREVSDALDVEDWTEP